MVNPTYFTTDTLTICDNELPYTHEDSLLSTAGDYRFDYQTINGCDSSIQLTLSSIQLIIITIPLVFAITNCLIPMAIVRFI